MYAASAVAVERQRSGRTVVDDVLAAGVRSLANVECPRWQSTWLEPLKRGVVDLDLVFSDAEVRDLVDIAGAERGVENEDVLASKTSQRVGAAATVDDVG